MMHHSTTDNRRQTPSRGRFARADALALGFLALLACGMMAPFVFQGRVPLNADFVLTRFEPWWHTHDTLRPQNSELDDPAMYIYPTRELSAAMLRRGTVPLWNPYILCGIPMLADSVSLPFDPFGLLALVLPFPTAWGTIILAQLVVAGWSMYALMRHYGCSRAAGVLSGATLMLCGTFTVWLEYVSWIGTFCWAPLCLLGLHAGIRGRRTLPFVGAGVLMGLTLLGGLLQLALYFFAMMGIYAVWQTAAEHRLTRETALSLARLALAFALAVLLGCAQLLPSVEAAAATYRAPLRYVGANHLPFAELATYIAPNLYGHPAWHDQFYSQAGITGFLFRHGGYVGILPLALALFAVVRLRRDQRVLCHGLLSVGNVAFLVLLGLGLEPVVLGVFPAFGALHAKRQVVVYGVSAAVLAGFGLDALLAADRGRVRAVARAVGIAALAALAAVVALDIYCRLGAGSAPEVLASWQQRSPGGVLVLYRGVATALLLLGATWALLRFGPRLGRPRWALALVVFAAFDLLHQARLYNPFVPRDWLYPPSAATQWLRRQPGVFRISGVSPDLETPHPRLDWWDRRYKGDTLPPNTAMPYRLCDVRGRSSLFPRRIREYAERITGNDDIRVLIDYRDREHRMAMVRLLSPRYVLSPTPLAGEEYALVRDGPLRIYENRRALPRAFVAARCEVIADDAAALRRLAVDPPDLRRCVVLSRPPQPPAATGPSTSGSSPGARIECYGPNEVRVRVEAAEGGFLVLTDTWYPGWRAFVDGRPRAVLRANYLMRCVAVAAGEREVRFVYEPQAFRLGLFLSLVGVAMVFASLGATLGTRARREAKQ